MVLADTQHLTNKHIESDIEDLLRYKYRAHLASITGIALASAGSVALAATIGFAIPTMTGSNALTLGSALGAVAIIIGVVLVAIAALALRGRSLDEAWLLGYDSGVERGFAQARSILETAKDTDVGLALFDNGSNDEDEEKDDDGGTSHNDEPRR